MVGNRQRKSSGYSFPLFGMFKSRNSRPQRAEYDTKDDFMKVYKVWPSDEDRGRWVAEPGIDKKACAYISTITEENWNSKVLLSDEDRGRGIDKKASAYISTMRENVGKASSKVAN